MSVTLTYDAKTNSSNCLLEKEAVTAYLKSKQFANKVVKVIYVLLFTITNIPFVKLLNWSNISWSKLLFLSNLKAHHYIKKTPTVASYVGFLM